MQFKIKMLYVRLQVLMVESMKTTAFWDIVPRSLVDADQMFQRCILPPSSGHFIDSCSKVSYMGDVQEPEKVNDTYVKTMLVGTVDTGFTVLSFLQ
jgi:hypothetical protein